jgi:hypothetical protein
MPGICGYHNPCAHIWKIGKIKVFAEKTSDAAKTFNGLFARGDDVAGAFHLTS